MSRHQPKKQIPRRRYFSEAPGYAELTRVHIGIPGYALITCTGITKLIEERDKAPLNRLPDRRLDVAIMEAESLVQLAEVYGKKAELNDAVAAEFYLLYCDSARRVIEKVRREAERLHRNAGLDDGRRVGAKKQQTAKQRRREILWPVFADYFAKHPSHSVQDGLNALKRSSAPAVANAAKVYKNSRSLCTKLGNPKKRE